MASEREFKVARDLANGARTRLKPSSVQRLLFLKKNLKAIGYQSVDLPMFCPLDMGNEEENDVQSTLSTDLEVETDEASDDDASDDDADE